MFKLEVPPETVKRMTKGFGEQLRLPCQFQKSGEWKFGVIVRNPANGYVDVEDENGVRHKSKWLGVEVKERRDL